MLEISEALKRKEEAFHRIELRENEIAGIRDCKIAAKRKLRRSNRRTEARAFKGYMDLFYRPQKKIQVVKLEIQRKCIGSNHSVAFRFQSRMILVLTRPLKSHQVCILLE